MGAPLDLIGVRFDRLTVIGLADRAARRERTWACRCDCGKLTAVSTTNLRSGRSKGCGCVRTWLRHGHKRMLGADRTYGAWSAMKARCNNPKNIAYPNYGGRGITVCERWASFVNFLADMGECPAGFSIERADVNSGYSPENCSWIAQSEQAKNTRRTVRIEWRGRPARLSDVCSEVGLKPTNVCAYASRRKVSHQVALDYLLVHARSRVISPELAEGLRKHNGHYAEVCQ